MLRLSLSLIRLVAWLVPAERRDAWRQEWEAEVRHRWRTAPSDRAGLLGRAAGALPDAAWLRRQFTLDSEWFQDLSQGVRLASRAPGLAAAVTLVLSAMFAAVVTLFALADPLVLRPLPFPNPERVVTLWQTSAKERSDKGDVAPANFIDWRERNRSFEILAAAIPYSYDVLDGPEPENWPAVQVTEGFFDAAGARFLFGRGFRPDEHVSGRDQSLVLSYGLWQTRFAGDPAIVGRDVRFADGAHTVVGILPRDFELGLLPRGAGRTVFTPHVSADYERRTRGSAWWNVVGRLRKGVRLEAAQAEFQALSATLAAENPKTNDGVGARLLPLRDHLVAGVRPALLALFWGSVLLVVIAWSNVAGLLLARTLAREQEFGVRAALGACASRLRRQLLVETLVLVGAAAGLGLLVARVLVATLVRATPIRVPRLELAAVDGRSVAFLLVLSAATALACTLLPMLRIGRARVLARAGTGRSPARQNARRGLVVAQLAAAVVLLAACGLLLRSVAGLLSIDPGFKKDHLISLQLFAWGRNRTPEKRVQYFQEIERRVSGVPGVAGVGAVTMMPFSDNPIAIRGPLTIEGRVASEPGQEQQVLTSVTSAGFFPTMHVPLRRGRFFEPRDDAGASAVAVINDALEQRFFPGEDALGRRISVNFAGQAVSAEIVGIVGSVRQARLERAALPELFLPHAQVPYGGMTLVVRSQVPPALLFESVRRAVWSIDPQQTFPRSGVVDEMVERTLADRLFLMRVSGTFAALALMLSAIGAYGLLSYLVATRTVEIGVRLALGARGSEIVWLVLAEGASLLAVGLGLGLIGAAGVGRALTAFLFGVSAHDAVTLAAVTLSVLSVGLLASLLPALRASRVDPVRALRAE